jgi:hypothetical protein
MIQNLIFNLILRDILYPKSLKTNTYESKEICNKQP